MTLVRAGGEGPAPAPNLLKSGIILCFVESTVAEESVLSVGPCRTTLISFDSLFAIMVGSLREMAPLGGSGSLIPSH